MFYKIDQIGAFRLGGIQQLRGQDEGEGGQKMFVFVHAQGIKTFHAVGGVGGSNIGKILST